MNACQDSKCTKIIAAHMY